MAKKAEDVNQKIVEELLSKGDPSQLFGKDGLFNQLKKQIVERVLESELDHELGYSKHSKIPKNLFKVFLMCYKDVFNKLFKNIYA